ncbi:hypothetical protein QBC45DRAFT_159240 [Copromyces sp. CBS 386.78]|nr:hypothetical protein QBC45DRAFT_159240 [Copromyces sp. CBS 386.78]
MNHKHRHGSGSKGRVTVRGTVGVKQGIARQAWQTFWSGSEREVFISAFVRQKNIAFLLHPQTNGVVTNWSMNRSMSHVSHLLPLVAREHHNTRLAAVRGEGLLCDNLQVHVFDTSQTLGLSFDHEGSRRKQRRLRAERRVSIACRFRHPWISSQGYHARSGFMCALGCDLPTRDTQGQADRLPTEARKQGANRRARLSRRGRGRRGLRDNLESS